MQSFLQYRRFGKRLEAQLERNGEKLAELRRQRRQAREQADNISAESSPSTSGEVSEKEQQEEQQPQDAAAAVQRTSSTSPEEDLERGETPEVTGADLDTMTTHDTTGTTLGLVLTGIEVRDRTTKEGGPTLGKVFVVSYEGDKDPMDPYNWSFARRAVATFVLSLIGGVVGWASAIDSAAIPKISEAFGVSDVAASLSTGIFLIGFGVGALISGPFSETVGRNPIYIATLVFYMLFLMGAGLAQHFGTLLVCRFFAGMFGATPLVCAGGSLSDLWTPAERVYAFPMFACASFLGPLLGPVAGSWIGQTGVLSWRWVEWVSLIFSGLVLAIVVLFQPETYGPILLKWKAEHLRRLTGDKRYRGAIEVRKIPLIWRLIRSLYRPFLMTAREVIIMLFALYLTVIYIVLFTFLTGYTYIYTDTYQLSQGKTGLCFLGIAVGIVLSAGLIPVNTRLRQRDIARAQAQGHDRVAPESRLYWAMFGAPAIPISLFWMGWTARPSISLWSPLLASVLFGFGIICVFMSSYQYLIDSYEIYAASALASVTLIRYVASGAMIEFSIPFYKNMGVAYTLTILGSLSAILVPIPFVFYKYGPLIRKKSKYAAS
ncbi:hypothetical protein VTN77DRAFT_1275 [Rasamsonia byssochlamydoides]|uniref:uncharacterized protein n=1 Tax=Rasamsonia byssochlamydoides TaxID=89139 RepID=UPI003742F096